MPRGSGSGVPDVALANQVLVVSTLAGFPLALILSWVYGIHAGSIRRTHSKATLPRVRALVWLGLGISVLAAAALAWVWS
jgi:hypothetical protein